MFNSPVQFGYRFVEYYLIDRTSSYPADWNLFKIIIIADNSVFSLFWK